MRKKTKKGKKNPARFATGEWFGRVFDGITSDERRTFAKHAQTRVKGRKVPCPFLSQKGHTQYCNKKSGVCSIRRHRKAAGSGLGAACGPFVITCPNRFAESRTIYEWIGQILLET